MVVFSSVQLSQLHWNKMYCQKCWECKTAYYSFDQKSFRLFFLNHVCGYCRLKIG